MSNPAALPIDHLVINVHRNLPAAAGLFNKLGFTLTPMGRHTLGSINHLMVFGDDYIELIGLPQGESTGRSELLDSPVGMDGLVFKTNDADHTHAQLQALGEPLQPVQSFSRPVELHGTRVDARFRTVRFTPGRFAAGRIYYCEHGTPELVWRPEWQSHACGAQGIAGLLLVSTNPAQDARDYALISGGAARRGAHGEHRIDGEHYAIVVVNPQDYLACFGALARDALGRSSYFGAIAIRVRDLGPVRRILTELESEPLDGPLNSLHGDATTQDAEYVFRDRGDRIAVAIPGLATLIEFVEVVS